MQATCSLQSYSLMVLMFWAKDYWWVCCLSKQQHSHEQQNNKRARERERETGKERETRQQSAIRSSDPFALFPAWICTLCVWWSTWEEIRLQTVADEIGSGVLMRDWSESQMKGKGTEKAGGTNRKFLLNEAQGSSKKVARKKSRLFIFVFYFHSFPWKPLVPRKAKTKTKTKQ